MIININYRQLLIPVNQPYNYLKPLSNPPSDQEKKETDRET